MMVDFFKMYLRVSNFGADFGYLFVKVRGVYEILLIQPVVDFLEPTENVFFFFGFLKIPKFQKIWVSKPWAMDLYILGRSDWCIQQKSILAYICTCKYNYIHIRVFILHISVLYLTLTCDACKLYQGI